MIFKYIMVFIKPRVNILKGCLLCKTIKSILFLVYMFSSAPLYAVYVLLLLLTLYKGPRRR